MTNPEVLNSDLEQFKNRKDSVLNELDSISDPNKVYAIHKENKTWFSYLLAIKLGIQPEIKAHESMPKFRNLTSDDKNLVILAKAYYGDDPKKYSTLIGTPLMYVQLRDFLIRGMQRGDISELLKNKKIREMLKEKPDFHDDILIAALNCKNAQVLQQVLKDPHINTEKYKASPVETALELKLYDKFIELLSEKDLKEVKAILSKERVKAAIEPSIKITYGQLQFFERDRLFNILKSQFLTSILSETPKKKAEM